MPHTPKIQDMHRIIVGRSTIQFWLFFFNKEPDVIMCLADRNVVIDV